MKLFATTVFTLLVVVCSINTDAAELMSKIFKGTINNKYPIMMILQFWNGHCTGAYYYRNNSSALLPLFGSAVGDSVTINEYVNEQNGTFSGSFRSDTSVISGFWNNRTKTKQYSFKVTYQRDTMILLNNPTGIFTYSALTENLKGETYSMTQYEFAVVIQKTTENTCHYIIRCSGLGAMEGEIIEDTLKHVSLDFRCIKGTVGEKTITDSFGGPSFTIVILSTGNLLVNGFVFNSRK